LFLLVNIGDIEKKLFVSYFRGKYLYEMKKIDMASLSIRYAEEMKTGKDHITLI